jgi:hypothetical protein
MINISIVAKTRGLAYIVIQDSEILDWGIKRFSPKNSQERIVGFLLSLIYLGDIEHVFINEIDQNQDTLASNFSKSLENALSGQSVSFHEVSDAILKQAFDDQSRYKNAEKLIRDLPEIAHLLKREKRLWESEDASMLLFDAAVQAKALDLI